MSRQDNKVFLIDSIDDESVDDDDDDDDASCSVLMMPS